MWRYLALLGAALSALPSATALVNIHMFVSAIEGSFVLNDGGFNQMADEALKALTDSSVSTAFTIDGWAEADGLTKLDAYLDG